MEWLYKSKQEIWASYSPTAKLVTVLFIIALNLAHLVLVKKAKIKGTKDDSEWIFFVIVEIGLIIYAIYLALHL